MIRLLSSPISVGASQPAGTVIQSKIGNLSNVVPSKALAKPYGLLFLGSVPSDLYVTKVSLKSEKDDEKVYRVYEANGSEKILLSDVAEMLKPDAAGTPVSKFGFNPDHGLMLELVVESTTAYTADVLWKIGNAGPLPGQDMVSFLASQGVDLGDKPREVLSGIIPRPASPTL